MPQPVPHQLERAQLLDLYYYMRLTRTLEERLSLLKRQGKLVGNVYRSLGQEADAVGSAYALETSRGDVFAPLIRNVGSLLVHGATPLEIFRQNLATESGPTRGRELNFNFADLARGFVPHISSLGNMVPVMAGVALNFKIRGEPRVALVYSGDGATSTGSFHEGLNFAAVQRVPLVVVVEYNHYAYSTPARLQFAVEHLVDKVGAYGIPGVRADGNDVLEVYGVTREAVDRARNGHGVTLIELETYRRRGHAEHDDQRYVADGEIERWEQNDPLDRFAAKLTQDGGWFTSQDLAGRDARARREVDAAAEQCLTEAMPPGEAALGGVFADPPGTPRLWFRAADERR